MSGYISHVATIEIPVRNLQQAIEFYTEVVGVEVEFQGERNAMLTFHKKGVPTIFLVQTSIVEGLSFENTNNRIVHSVLDFYTHDLKGFYEWLQTRKVEVGPFNVDPAHGFGGFGFRDPDGNLLSATNVLHKGQ